MTDQQQPNIHIVNLVVDKELKKLNFIRSHLGLKYLKLINKRERIKLKVKNRLKDFYKIFCLEIYHKKV